MKPEVRLLCVCQALLSFGMGLAFPFFAIFLHRERAMPMTWVGGWLSASVLATALSQGWGGELSDRFGRRRVMIASLWARAASVLAIAFAIREDLSVAVIIAVHLISSFVSHFFEPAARGWIADFTQLRDRHRAYGWLRIATYMGFAVGPALGGLIADRSYFLAFAASSAVCALCAGVSGFLLKDQAGKRTKKGPGRYDGFEGGVDRNFMMLCVYCGTLSIAMAQLVVPLSIYATQFVGLKDSQIGMLLSLNGLLVVLFQIPAVNFFSGVRLTVAVALGALMYALGYAAVGMAGGFFGLAAAVGIVTIGEILVPSSIQTLAANMSPEKQRGRYLGVLGTSRQIGSAIGPIAGCAGLDFAMAHGMRGHWFAITAVAGIAAAGFFALGRRLLPDEEGLLSDSFEV